MNGRGQIRQKIVHAAAWLASCAALSGLCISAQAQTSAPAVLDRVVAVVNRQAILLSDVDADIELSAIDPSEGGHGAPTPPRALEELISRALIQQQIRQEDLQSDSPTAAEVKARIGEIRRELPACVRADCATDAGWEAFLSAHHLTEARVEAYVRNRMEILSFIEERFRQGIEITRQQVETYYQKTLLPEYSPGETAPPLSQVSSRIQEILLQQQVNALFDTWLDSLRSQGDVEILDPALETAQSKSAKGDASE
ncbi:MAG: peptidylprolyl isomerase [Terracidiphilus sp.]